MKKIIRNILSLVSVLILVASLFSCGNAFQGDSLLSFVEKESGMGITITLPGSSKRSPDFYTQDDAARYVIQILQNRNVCTEKNGLPGETVTLKVSEEGTYVILVKAFDAENNLIAEGSVSKELTYEAGVIPVKVVVNPKQKTIEIEVDVEWVYPESTTITFNIAGDDAEKFKFCYYANEKNRYVVSDFPATVNVLDYDRYNLNEEGFRLECSVFIDSNEDNLCNSDEIKINYWDSYKIGEDKSVELEIVKDSVSVNVEGDLSIFTNPKIVVNTTNSGYVSRAVAPINAESVTFYSLKNESGHSVSIAAVSDINDDNMYTFGEDYLISDECYVNYMDTLDNDTVTLTLFTECPKVLPVGSKIDFRVSSVGSAQYGFYVDEWYYPDGIIFHVPAGPDTDSIIPCDDWCDLEMNGHTGDHLWWMIHEVHKVYPEKCNDMMKHWQSQNVSLLQDFKDIVNYLENDCGLEVFGKELLEAIVVE